MAAASNRGAPEDQLKSGGLYAELHRNNDASFDDVAASTWLSYDRLGGPLTVAPRTSDAVNGSGSRISYKSNRKSMLCGHAPSAIVA